MKKVLIGLIILIGLGAVGLGIYFNFIPASSDPVEIVLDKIHVDELRKLQLQYPASFEKQEITEVDADEVSLEIKQTNPEMQITVWQESGLGFLKSFNSKPLLEQLRDNVDRRFSSAYPELEKEGIKEVFLGGQSAFQVRLTFLRPGSKIRERILVTVTEKNDSAFYVQCLAPIGVWQESEAMCLAVTESFKFL